MSVYTVALYTVLAGGLAPALGYLALHRPTSWRAARAVDSSGWVAIICLLYAQALARMLVGPGPSFDGWADLLTLGIGVAVDALLWLRALRFWRAARALEDPARPRGQP